MVRLKLATEPDPDRTTQVPFPTAVRPEALSPEEPTLLTIPWVLLGEGSEPSAPVRATVLVEPGIEAQVQGGSWDDAGPSAGPALVDPAFRLDPERSLGRVLALKLSAQRVADLPRLLVPPAGPCKPYRRPRET